MFFVLAIFFLFADPSKALLSESEFVRYKWAVKVKGGVDIANKVADEAGLRIVDSWDEDYYLMEPIQNPQPGFRRRPRRAIATGKHFNVEWAQPQIVHYRTKRDNGFLIIDRVTGDTVLDSSGANSHFNLMPRSSRDHYIAKHKKPDDPLWDEEWYLTAFGGPYSMNITEAWRMGYSGKGVVVSVLDDGLEFQNDDLFPNYVS